MYFDFDALYNETQSDAFASGKKKYYDNKVRAVSSASLGGKTEVVASVEGARSYRARITFDEQGGLYDYSCDCDGFSPETGPCKHIVAAALSFEERNPSSRQTSGRKTDTGALSLISAYNDLRRKRFAAGDGTVELVPYLNISDGVSLRFTIGAGRQYNLRDIADFAGRMQSGGYRRYGVDLELNHVPESFTPLSARLADFLVKIYLERQETGRPLQYKDEIKLTRAQVDEFFGITEGTLVRLGKSDLVLVAPFSDPIPIKAVVRREDEGFSISLDRSDFSVVAGRDHYYIFEGSRVYRADESFERDLGPLIETLTLKKRLFVAESDMSSFYNGVLVAVAAHIDIECEDGLDLSVYEAEPLTCKIFVGAEDGEVSARVEAAYDDSPIDILGDFPSGNFVRDWDTENAIRGILLKYFRQYPTLTLGTDDEIFNFLTDGVRELVGYCEVFVPEGMNRLRVIRPPRVRVGVRLTGDLLSLDLAADGFDYDELLAIVRAYREKKRYVRLKGGFVNLADASIEALGDVLDSAKPAADGTLTLPRYYAPYVNDELRTGFFTLTRDSAFKNLVKSLESAESADLAVPESLAPVMRNYQKTGFRWLKILKDNGFGGILADDMGLGKSLQVIALLMEKKASAIIVCPTTLMLNWLDEIRKFAPSLNAVTVMGTPEERKAAAGALKGDEIVITSYDLIRRDIDLYAGRKFDYAIADEAQFIKNPGTRNAVAVKKIDAAYRFALTGTPVENNLGELWSIFDFIMPGYLGSYETFRSRYELDVVSGDENAAQKLRRVVKPFILRRLKSDVLKELPPKTETVVGSPLAGEQKDVYAANLALVRESLTGEARPGRVVVLSMLTRLRQICCDPVLIDPEYAGNSAKTDACMELVETAVGGGHRILLFSQFTSMLDIIRKKLVERGISHYLLRGDTPKAERMRLVKRFNENDVSVFLISLKAGGTGLNLTGADVVIHYDPWWNESVMNQATDRAYRMGQVRSVQVYKLVMKGTVEEKIMELQSRKSALSSSIVGKGNGIDEILELLS